MDLLDAELDYNQTNQFMTSNPILPDFRNQNLINLADEFHQAKDVWLPDSAKVYNLIGCQAYDTIGSYMIEENGSIDINSVTGDGTVPLASAKHIPSDKTYFVSYPVTKINHVDLIRDPRTVDLIYGFIETNDEPILPAGISKTESDCDNILDEVLRFSTHSPVNLHVYDNAGNHTGLTPEGNIETDIPDSNFTQVGNNTFIFVSASTSYSVKIDAYATGSFDFKIKKLIGGEVQDEIKYSDVPISHANLEAALEFASIASPSLLNLDENGDGQVDTGYSTGGERILYRGIDNVIDDINMAYNLGWILNEKERDSYLQKLGKILKIEKKIEILEETIPYEEKKIQKLEKKIDKLLATQFLNDLERDYNKSRINNKAYNLIKYDILWLLEN